MGEEHTEGWTKGGVYGCPMEGHETVWFPDWASYDRHMEAEHPGV